MNASNSHFQGDRRFSIHTFPAIILAVSLITGCFLGRFTLENNTSWLAAATSFISILAMVQPSPLALGTVGLVTGIALENLKLHPTGTIPRLPCREITLKGKILKKTMSPYGQSTLTINATEVLETASLPVSFPLTVDLPSSDNIVSGTEGVLRSGLKGYTRKRLSVIRGRTVGDGWYSGSSAPSMIIYGRERFSRALDNLPDGPASAMLGAVSLGERWRVDTRTRDILRKTGTYHLLAISGVHVGAAIVPLFFLLRLYASSAQYTCPRKSRTALLFLSFITIYIYFSFSGLSASALRASIYFFLVGSALVAGRSSHFVVSLSWCVVLITCFSIRQQPDISLVLSALAVAGIVMSGRGEGRFWQGMVRMTLGAVLFTLPFAVWLAGGISVIAPVGNAVAGIPFGLLLIPMAVLMDFAALLPRSPLEPMLLVWLKSTDLLFVVLAHLADLPFSFQRLSTAGCISACITAIAGVLVWHHKKYHLGVGIAVFISVLVVSECGHYIDRKSSHNDLVITFPAVGQADAAIIRLHGRTVLIDSGPSGIPGLDSPAVKTLRRLGVRNIDTIFLSHLHPDHSGGFNDITAIWPVLSVYMPDRHTAGEEGGGALDNKLHAPHVRLLGKGNVVKIGSMTYSVLGPDQECVSPRDINRDSLQLLLEVDDFQALFTGDAGWDQVLDALHGVDSLNLLKIPHHGSKKDFPPAGMIHTFERIGNYGDLTAVCPSGRPGSRHLPAPEVVRWFTKMGIKLVYTGDKGVNISYKRGGSMGNSRTVVDNHDRF